MRKKVGSSAQKRRERGRNGFSGAKSKSKEVGNQIPVGPQIQGAKKKEDEEMKLPRENSPGQKIKQSRSPYSSKKQKRRSMKKIEGRVEKGGMGKTQCGEKGGK